MPRTNDTPLVSDSGFPSPTDSVERAPFAVGDRVNGRYLVRKTLGRGGMGVVYDVEDALHPTRAVALKTMLDFAGGTAMLSLLKAEFATMTKLDHPNVARVYDFEQLQGSDDFLITMERIDGRPLDDALGANPSLASVVEHLVQICRALAYVHSRRVVHFDLKPKNILVDGAGIAKLVDFGIAGPASLAQSGKGTLHYMAPELIFAEEGADHRVDLYALGVTMYQIVVGAMPCNKGSLLEIADWAMRDGVRFPAGHASPKWLGQMIEKLCAKDATDRYRSANAVIKDVNRHGGYGYQLETEETRRSYISTPRFAGRHDELARVMGFLHQRFTNEARTPALLVSGVSGAGKSRLMKEVRQTAQLERMLFFESHCDERGLGEYEPMAELLYQLVPIVEAKDGTELVQAALPALVKIAPRLANRRAVGELSRSTSKDEENAHVMTAVADFVAAAATRVTAVVCVNDLHWASLGLVRLIADIFPRASGLVFIGTYRSDEVKERALDQLLQRRELVETIELPPLTKAAIQEIIHSMLGVDDIPPEFLERVTSETAGNPYFVQEVMRALFENGSVFLAEGRWATHGSIGELRLPATMVEVLRRRFSLLSSDERVLLRLLAVHGRAMSLDLLRALSADATLFGALAELQSKGIVARGTTEIPHYYIVHDRMRETAYADLDADERRRLHAAIGEKLEALTRADPALAELARHFWFGEVYVKALAYSRAAAAQALEHHAHEESFVLLERSLGAARALGRSSLEQRSIIEDLGLAAVRSGRIEQAKAHYRSLLETATTNDERARFHHRLGQVYSAGADQEMALAELELALALVGASFPRSRLAQIMSLLVRWLALIMRVRTGFGFGAAAGAERLRRETVATMLSSAWPYAVFESDYWLLGEIAVRSAHNNHFLGMNAENARALTQYGLWLGVAFGPSAKKAIDRAFTRAIVIARAVKDDQAQAQAQFQHGVSLCQAGHETLGLQVAFDAYGSLGDRAPRADIASYSMWLARMLALQGKSREVVAWIEKDRELFRRGDVAIWWRSISCELFAHLTIMGRSDEAAAVRAAVEAVEPPSAKRHRAFYHGNRLLALAEVGELGEDFERACSELAATRYESMMAFHFYLVIARVRLAQYRAAALSGRAAAWRKLQSAIADAARGRLPRATRYPVLRCQLRVLQSAAAHERGQHRRARVFLTRGARDASTSDSVFGAWLIACERSHQAFDAGRLLEAKQASTEAFAIATREGWPGRARAT